MAKAKDKFIALREWVAEAQVLLGVDSWELTIVEAASDVDAWADIDAHPQQPTADLRVGDPSPESYELVLRLSHLSSSSGGAGVELHHSFLADRQ